MKQSVDAVVIGSGIIGASISFQLAQRGVSVTLLDKASGPAEGSTGASAAFIRCRYSHPEVVKLAYDSQNAFRQWSSFTGLDDPRAEFHEAGALWMLGKSTDEMLSERDALRAQGVRASLLNAEEAKQRFPALSTCDASFDLAGEVEHVCRDGEAFLFEEEAGFIDPVGATQDLVEGGRRAGAEARFRTTVTGIQKSGSRVAGVVLADGTSIEAPLVVNAAGPWCNQLNQLAGVDLRWTLTPTRIQMVHRPWPANAGPIPITIDMATMNGYRLEASGEQVLTISGRPEDETERITDSDDFKTSADATYKDINLAALHHRFPSLEARGTPGGIAGLYTINRADHHPIVGPTELDGFWVANGFSGHGLKLAPGIGSMVARSITGDRKPFDTEVSMSLFSRDRKPLALGVKNVFA